MSAVAAAGPVTGVQTGTKISSHPQYTRWLDKPQHEAKATNRDKKRKDKIN